MLLGKKPALLMICKISHDLFPGYFSSLISHNFLCLFSLCCRHTGFLTTHWTFRQCFPKSSADVSSSQNSLCIYNFMAKLFNSFRSLLGGHFLSEAYANWPSENSNSTPSVHYVLDSISIFLIACWRFSVGWLSVILYFLSQVEFFIIP